MRSFRVSGFIQSPFTVLMYWMVLVFFDPEQVPEHASPLL